jgi:hypothetical protein
MPAAKAHRWTFRARFRANAFGWRSDMPIKRIKEAVTEIKAAARKDKILGAEGAVILLEKVSGALEHVDSSSGAIGSAVNHMIETLAPIIAQAPASANQRDKWLERLWRAIEDDAMPYIELLADHWGELCVTAERASQWADRFLYVLRMIWSPELSGGGHFKGTAACLSALYAAGRHDELLHLLERSPYKFWHDRQWGVRALVAQGKVETAIRYAEDSRRLNQPDGLISSACEKILLTSGQWREAYDQYALAANRQGTYLATFKAVTTKYPQIEPKTILADLIAGTPGEEGKWFTAAKSIELFAEAAELAWAKPCDPKTLTRAARDFSASKPDFASAVGLAALRWLLSGYGYDLTARDAVDAFNHTFEAARRHGAEANTVRMVQLLIEQHPGADRTFIALLRQRLAELAKTSAA